MQKLFLLLFSLLFSGEISIQAQSYTTIIKGGHVIDPKNNIDRVMDVAILDGKIARVAQNIDPKESKQVIDAKGLYVTPGLIDIHGHVFAGTMPDGQLEDGSSGLAPDGFTLRVGVTTIVDAGSSGAKTFSKFKANIIDRSKTRVLAFLNISNEGMRSEETSIYQQNVDFMDPKMAADTAKKYKDYIVGFKLAHFRGPSFIPMDRAVEAGNLANMPVMVDFGESRPMLSIEELFTKHLRPGDIFTHMYGRQLERRETIVDLETKKLKPFVPEARKRGIIFDVGHGGASFYFSQAIPATKAGFYPETISTDLHTGSMNSAMKDILNVMSKMMALNMDLQSVIRATTWSSAKAIKHEELGNLSVGAIADIAVLNLRQGKFGFFDNARYKVMGKQLLECEMTIKGGTVAYDRNGMSIPLPTEELK
jgi:dihydroorotase